VGFSSVFQIMGTPVLPLWQRVHKKRYIVTSTTTTTRGDIESSRQREAAEKVHLLLLLHAARRQQPQANPHPLHLLRAHGRASREEEEVFQGGKVLSSLAPMWAGRWV